MTRAERKAATREKCVAAAQRAFREQGYEAVTFRALSLTCGVSAGHFFAFWPSKDALFLDVMGRRPPDVLGFLQRVIDSPDVPEPLLSDARSILADLRGQ